VLGDHKLDLDQYVPILRRRLWWIVIPTILLPVLAYCGSFLIPKSYTSVTLVLVERQRVADELLKPVAGEELNERLATMREQILSRARLQPIVERFGLFPSEVGKVPMEDLLDQMRTMISVTGVRAEFGTRTGGLPGFYISFTAQDPHLAQQVCSEITSIFMQENLLASKQSAQGTTDFLTGQLEGARRRLDDQDAKLAAFKERYLGQLPGQEQTNLSVLATLNARLDTTNQAVYRAQQDETFAQSLLAQQLASRQASRSGRDPDGLEKRLGDLESHLAALEVTYTSKHPDVVRTKHEIAQVEKQLAAATSSSANDGLANGNPSQPEPSEIQRIRLQIRQLDDLKLEKAKEQEELQKQLRTYQTRMQMSPIVEQHYKALTRGYETAQHTYDDLLAKRTQSVMATNLVRKQEGEQFRVMDPPNLPERPSKPNRPAFALAGLIGGVALGSSLAFLFEMGDKTIRTAQDATFYLKLPVLVQIPVVLPSAKRQAPPSRSASA
jgi:polysaccharide chain length determinant protein (PEP-CTERM system associated)